MKINQPTSQGSFGIPPHLKQAQQEALENKKKADERQERERKLTNMVENTQEPNVVEDDFGLAPGEKMPRAEADEDAKVREPIDPLKNLKELGIELEDEDFQKLLFKGFIEKDVEVVPSIRGSKPLVATFKLLTTNEYDLIDELIGEDIKVLNMTNDGFQSRRSAWILAVGITKLMGKPVCPPVLRKDKNIDLKATYRRKRDILGLLSPAVITKMMKIHGTFTVTANAIVADPEADYLKK
jgi:hypothetical protein